MIEVDHSGVEGPEILYTCSDKDKYECPRYDTYKRRESKSEPIDSKESGWIVHNIEWKKRKTSDENSDKSREDMIFFFHSYSLSRFLFSEKSPYRVRDIGRHILPDHRIDESSYRTKEYSWEECHERRWKEDDRTHSVDTYVENRSIHIRREELVDELRDSEIWE